MAKNWAIVIGINHYEHHPERKLQYAVRDAELMRDFLIHHAQFDADQVISCLGDEAYRGQPTYPACGNLLRWLTRELHPRRLGQIDRFWFFFSGHGISENGQDYLIACDGLQEDRKRFALSIDEITAALRLHENAEIVLILDQCRERIGSKDFGSEIGVQTRELAKQRGITTIFSCDYGQYSYELETIQSGAFTYALVEGLKQHTLPAQLEPYLQRRVRELHQQAQKSTTQLPKIHLDSAQKANFPLLPDCATVADITQLKEQAVDAFFANDFDLAEHLWELVNECATRPQDRRLAMNAIKQIAQRRVPFSPPQPQTQSPSNPQDSSPKAPTEKPQATSNQQATKSFQFEVVNVNDRGKVTQRQGKNAQYFSEDLGNGISLEMVAIPGNTFQMGADEYDREQPIHTVTIAPFFMGKYAVTQAQWQQVAGFPKVERDLDPDPAFFKGAKHPVEQVSWEEAVEFCARLSRKMDKDYRLPSEAEWEYACRANTTTPFCFGPTITPDLVNYDGNHPYGNAAKGKYREETTEVGSFPPNGFGLYDMHGNVWEWCADPWHKNYQGAPTDGSAWEKGGENNSRLLRGGSWFNYAVNCRSALRYGWGRGDRYGNFGFRVVCSSPRTL